eukprot:scaffold3898_cov401-Prasinococcus_capsulatus_cf.AAC.9
MKLGVGHLCYYIARAVGAGEALHLLNLFVAQTDAFRVVPLRAEITFDHVKVRVERQLARAVPASSQNGVGRDRLPSLCTHGHTYTGTRSGVKSPVDALYWKRQKYWSSRFSSARVIHVRRLWTVRSQTHNHQSTLRNMLVRSLVNASSIPSHL